MIYVLLDPEASSQLKQIAKAALVDQAYWVTSDPHRLPSLTNQKILFCGQLDSCGVSLFLLKALSNLSAHNKASLAGSVGALLLHSQNEFYTKSASAHLIFLANQLGCEFIGHPLVEATGSLKNFSTWQKTLPLSLSEIGETLSQRMVTRLEAGAAPLPQNKKKLVFLHSSSRETSNTLTLWHMVAKHLSAVQIEELYVENGAVFDCFGCTYKACLEYGKQKSCYYGGIMTEKIIPSIEAANLLVWICPNYNDAISSNLTAVINRLTTLYRQITFHNKKIFAIIVSGNSGGDAIARQLINALNINKGFHLPARFALLETANDRGAILQVPHIDEKAQEFAQHILNAH